MRKHPYITLALILTLCAGIVLAILAGLGKFSSSQSSAGTPPLPPRTVPTWPVLNDTQLVASQTGMRDTHIQQSAFVAAYQVCVCVRVRVCRCRCEKER